MKLKLHLNQESKNQAITPLYRSLPNKDLVSMFFHWHPQHEICNKMITKDIITPQICCYYLHANTPKLRV